MARLACTSLIGWLLAVVLGCSVGSVTAAPSPYTILVSRNADGTPGNGPSCAPALGAEGRRVLFWSAATNIGDTTTTRWLADALWPDADSPGGAHYNDLWKYDPDANDWDLIKPAPGTPQPVRPSVSADWKVVVGDVLMDQGHQVFEFDLEAGTRRLISRGTDGQPGNHNSYAPSISANGRWVVYASSASNLVAGDTNQNRDIFVYDRATRQTRRISVGPGGVEANGDSNDPVISADGRYIAYVSDATNLVPAGEDTNGTSDIFLYDQLTGQTKLISRADSGQPGNGPSYAPSLSASGRYVAFASQASNLVYGDTNGCADVFRLDRIWGLSRVKWSDLEPNGPSGQPSISADGQRIAFTSAASNLVGTDHNGKTDVFVRTYGVTDLTLVSARPDGRPGNGNSGAPSISGDGRYVAFESEASNLAALDDNTLRDVFLRDLVGALDQIMAYHSPAAMQTFCQRWGPVVEILFSQAVQQGTAAMRLSVSVQDEPSDASTAVAGKITWPEPGLRLRWSPTTPLPANRLCTVTLAAGIRKQAGGRFNWSESFQFMTGNRPVVMAHSPEGDGVPVDTKISVTFDQAMRKATVESHFTVSPTVAGTFAWSGNQVIFRPKAALQPKKQYRVTIGQAAKSQAGVAMGRDFTWTFKTAAPAAVQIAGVAVSPTPVGGAEIVFSLTGDAEVEVRVLNVAGRVVRALAARPCVAGPNRLAWDGKGEDGLRAPGGQYVLQVTARGADGSQARALGSARIGDR